MPVILRIVLLWVFAYTANPVFAKDVELYSGNRNIVKFLLTPHPELETPDCLLGFLNNYQHQVFVAAGGNIDSVEVRTEFTAQGRRAWFIKLIYTLGTYQEMVCTLK